MKEIRIYMEGGGEKTAPVHSKSALRQGMDEFLREIKDAARAKGLRWKLVLSGSRDATYQDFHQADSQYDDAVVVLLVDSESPVMPHTSPSSHLMAREKKWDLHHIPDGVIHLMIQTMETWLVADPDSLSQYYGQHFQKRALPSPHNLEGKSKADVAKSLERATKRTSKGPYHKIRHASEILKRIDPHLVRQRCHSCERLFTSLLQIIKTQ